MDFGAPVLAFDHPDFVGVVSGDDNLLLIVMNYRVRDCLPIQLSVQAHHQSAFGCLVGQHGDGEQHVGVIAECLFDAVEIRLVDPSVRPLDCSSMPVGKFL